MKLYKLTPELHWAAGGYVWPVDRTVDCAADPSSPTMSAGSGPRTPGGLPAVRGPFSQYGDEDEGIAVESLRTRVVRSGGMLLTDAGVTVLRDWESPNVLMGKERVAMVNRGELEKLVVNALVLVYVP